MAPQLVVQHAPAWAVLELLGEGASGWVFRAQHQDTGVVGALKVGRDEAPLLQEVHGLLRLTREQGPRLLDAGRAKTSYGERPFVVVSFTEGDPLSRTWSNLPTAHEREALATQLLRDVASSLAELHALSVRHGDVKPDNLLVTPSGRIALIDLGLAASAGENFGGTPRYLSPEVLAGAAPGLAADLYALGLVALELLVPEARNARDLSVPLALPTSYAFTALVKSLLDSHPGARPTARMVHAVVDRMQTAPAVTSRLARLRASYLGFRAQELAEGAEPGPNLQGLPRAWVQEAHRILSALCTEESKPRPRPLLEPLSPFRRAVWLASVEGSVGLLVESPDSLSTADFSRADFDGSTDEGLTYLLGEGGEGAAGDPQRLPPEQATSTDWLVAAQSAAVPLAWLEHALANRDHLAEPQRLLATEAYLARGYLPEAFHLAVGGISDECTLLAADIARRQGRFGEAAQLLNRIGRMPSVVQQAHTVALRARLAHDIGERQTARQWLEASESLHPRLIEVRALLADGALEVDAALAELATAIAKPNSPLGKARLLATSGMLLHAQGRSALARRAFFEAAELAHLRGALVEEASYLTGEAAAATDAGFVEEALQAASRAALLWERLREPLRAARALLARAVALLTVGALRLAEESARLALARASGDALTCAYAELCLVEVALSGHRPARDDLPDAAVERVQHGLQRAWMHVADKAPGEYAHVLALMLEHRAIDATDSRVAGLDLSNLEGAARWSLVRAQLIRAEPDDAGAWLTAALLLLPQAGPLGVKGPACEKARDLALGRGELELARQFERARAGLAQTLRQHAPKALAAELAQVTWAAREAEETGLGERIDDLVHIASSLGERESLRRLFERVLDTMVQWTSAERGILLVRAPEGRLVPRAARNFARKELRGEQLDVSRTLAARALETGAIVVAHDALSSFGDLHASVFALKLRSVLVVPLISHGEVLGVAYLDDRARPGLFGVKERAWVRLVATQAAIAIRDAKDQALLRRAARKAARAEAKLAVLLAERERELQITRVELQQAKRATRFDYEAITGRSPRMQSLLRMVDRVTLTDVPVLILGESGTGKELIARAIHDNGSRRRKPFISENCAAVPEALLESTLFGHVRGAFTGAHANHAGLFDAADGGTLFLDEVGEMSLGMQVRLLRVLQDGEVRPVGSDVVRRVNVRILAATHRDLAALVAAGKFREDLFYRLDVVALRVPALREREGDIPELVLHFLRKYGGETSVKIAPNALRMLSTYGWPGNVRQLENEVRRALVMSEGTIHEADLAVAIRHQQSEGVAAAAGSSKGAFRTRVDFFERQLLQTALHDHHGNQTKAAEALGLSRFGLQKMVKRLGIKA